MTSLRLLGSFVALVCGLCSCTYHLVSDKSAALRNVHIPYVKGDLDGRLTDAIIKEIALSPTLSTGKGNYNHILDIHIKKNKNTHVGYRYDRIESTGELINRLIPIEERKKVILEVAVLDTDKQLIYGPFEVESHADFDFVNFDTYHDLAFVDQYGIARSSLSYSLGQLDAIEGANQSVYDALYETLAKKILVILENL